MRGDAAKHDADHEKGVEYRSLERLENCDEGGQVVIRSQHIKVTEEHPHHEHGPEPAVHDIHEVIHQRQLAPQPRVPRASREGEEGRVHDDRPSELDRDGPYVEAVAEPALPARPEHKCEVLDLAVPIPHFFPIGRLVLRVRPDPKGVPGSHVEEGGADDRDMESQPSSKHRRRNVVSELEQFPGLDILQRFRRQHIPRDDEEDGDREMPAGEECANPRQTGEVPLIVIPIRILKYVVGMYRVARPELMMSPIHHESCKASQPVKICRSPQWFA